MRSCSASGFVDLSAVDGWVGALSAVIVRDFYGFF